MKAEKGDRVIRCAEFRHGRGSGPGMSTKRAGTVVRITDDVVPGSRPGRVVVEWPNGHRVTLNQDEVEVVGR